MRPYSVLSILVLSCLGSSMGDLSCSCDCYPVTTTQDTLKEVMYAGQLYLEAASTNSVLAGTDSVCIRIGQSDSSCALFLEIITTGTDYSSFVEPAVVTTVKPGLLLQASIRSLLRYYLIGEPCEQVRVLYRCWKQGYPYAAGECHNDVWITSEGRYPPQSCIDDGIALAQEIFPCLDFVYLPNTVPDPCCTSPQIPFYP